MTCSSKVVGSIFVSLTLSRWIMRGGLCRETGIQADSSIWWRQSITCTRTESALDILVIIPSYKAVERNEIYVARMYLHFCFLQRLEQSMWNKSSKIDVSRMYLLICFLQISELSPKSTRKTWFLSPERGSKTHVFGFPSHFQPNRKNLNAIKSLLLMRNLYSSQFSKTRFSWIKSNSPANSRWLLF